MAIVPDLSGNGWPVAEEHIPTPGGGGGGSGDASAANQVITNTKLDAVITGLGDIEALQVIANGYLETLRDEVISTDPVSVIETPMSYEIIAASDTDEAVGTVAAGNILHSLLVVPTSVSPGAVSIEDGAGTNFNVFSGGTDSLTTLIPFPIDLRNIATTTGPWEITTGANMTVIAFYKEPA